MSKRKVPARVSDVQLLRRSGAAGSHVKRTPRAEVERRAIKEARE